MLKPASIRRYLVALSATFAGAWAMDLTGSMIPLALGASFTLICTASLVRETLTRGRRR